ncbi:MAG TPA: hypothetical protein VGQ15_08540 [Gaiellaceae bacterium]|jgi:hypothetical protein|nr:hypothetical protein [Gaiellaceae bacterium]
MAQTTHARRLLAIAIALFALAAVSPAAGLADPGGGPGPHRISS